MHKYNLTIKQKETNDTINLSGDISKEVWERLTDYTDYAGDLLKTKYVQSGMQSSLKMDWDKEKGLAISAKLPPWDDVIVFLHKFRPLGLQSESSYFYSICSILSKELNHPYFRAMIDGERKGFGGTKLLSVYQIQIDDILVNSEKVLYDWLNSFEYHREKSKRELIVEVQKVLPEDALKAIFLALLVQKTIAINNIAALTNVVLGKQKSVDGWAI